MTASGSTPRSTEATAAAVVVLPIPISPVIIILYPFSMHSLTQSMPTETACLHCSRVIAAPTAIFFVPLSTLRRISLSQSTSPHIPTSTAKTSALYTLAIVLMLEVPSAIAFATIPVTLLSVWVTPSQTTPLSAHIITAHRLSKEKFSVPNIPASLITSSSPIPRL